MIDDVEYTLSAMEMVWLTVTTPSYNLNCKLSYMAEWLHLTIPSQLLKDDMLAPVRGGENNVEALPPAGG